MRKQPSLVALNAPGASARAALPRNLRKPKKGIEAIPSLVLSGDLMRLAKLIAFRLQDYQAEVDGHGRFWSDGQPMTDNHLWLLLRADAESALPTVPRSVIRTMFEFTLRHIRQKCEAVGDERILIVASVDPAVALS